MKRKLIGLVMAMAMLTSFAPCAARAEAAASGECGADGNNAIWSLDDAGTLTISGTGDIADYGNYNLTPYYKYHDTIKKIIIENGITGIGQYSCSLSGVESIDIPDSVTQIKGEAFYMSRSLKSIELPKGLTVIEKDTFAGCRSLESIVIPDSVTDMNDSLSSTAYYSNKDNWQEGLLYLGRHLIKADDTQGLGECVIKPETVSIVGGAFMGCKTLTSVTIPEGIKTVKGGTFSGCSNLLKAEIPDSVTYIDETAFEGCASLVGIELSGNVTGIGNSAFRNCTSLEHIVIPDSVMRIGSYAFTGTAFLNNPENWENGVLYIGNHLIKADDSYINGEYTFQSPTVTIAGGAFERCKNLTHISIPYGITVLSDHTFSGCENLESADIPDSVNEIGNNVFFNCTSLKDINIPESVTKYGNYIFRGCASLPEIIIPYGTDTIQQGEYNGCSSAVSITFPDTVKNIYSGAFSDCKSLKELLLPDSVTYLSEFAFSGCGGLEYVKLSENLPSIYMYAFKGCTNLKSIKLPAKLQVIGLSAFDRCNRLLFEVDAENEYFSAEDGVLFNKDKSELVLYAKSMLEPVYTIPDGVKKVSGDAFGDYMTDITVPKSVTEISGLNDNIKDVYYMGTADEWSGVFKGKNLNASVHFNAIGSEAPIITGTPSVNDIAGGYEINIPLDSVEYDSQIIAVTYDNGRTTGFGTGTLSAGDTKKSITVSADVSDSVKVFIWDSFKSMRPLCEAKEITTDKVNK